MSVAKEWIALIEWKSIEVNRVNEYRRYDSVTKDNSMLLVIEFKWELTNSFNGRSFWMEEKDIDMKTSFRALIYYRLTEVDFLILFDSHGDAIPIKV